MIPAHSSKPLLLDLFCGAGGGAVGYYKAGFDVIGVDVLAQPNYPFRFVKCNVLDYFEDFPLGKFAAIHASPPCQVYTILKQQPRRIKPYRDLVGPTREALNNIGLPYVIENVPGAPMNPTIILCGSMFNLGSNGRQLRRHRLFESNIPMTAPPCNHQGLAIGVYGGTGSTKDNNKRRGGYQGTTIEKKEAMEIDWMTNKEINNAIPPAYTEYIGHQLIKHI